MPSCGVGADGGGGRRTDHAVTGTITVTVNSPDACPHRWPAALARAQRPGCWGTRDGRIVQLLVDVYENGVVFNLACVNRDGAAGKHTDGLAGGQVVA